MRTRRARCEAGRTANTEDGWTLGRPGRHASKAVRCGRGGGPEGGLFWTWVVLAGPRCARWVSEADRVRGCWQGWKRRRCISCVSGREGESTAGEKRNTILRGFSRQRALGCFISGRPSVQAGEAGLWMQREGGLGGCRRTGVSQSQGVAEPGCGKRQAGFHGMEWTRCADGGSRSPSRHAPPPDGADRLWTTRAGRGEGRRRDGRRRDGRRRASRVRLTQR